MSIKELKFLYATLLFGLLIASLTLLAQDTQAIPTIEQTERITLQSNKGWMLDIYPDGSGHLIHGSFDSASILQQTFSYQDVYNLLVSNLVKDYHEDKTIAVILRPKTPTGPVYGHNLEDKNIIKQLMSQARAKAIPNDPQRFKELLEKYSPVPDETPEEKAAGIAACMANAGTPIPLPAWLQEEIKHRSSATSELVSPSVPPASSVSTPSSQSELQPVVDTRIPFWIYGVILLSVGCIGGIWFFFLREKK